MKLCAVAFLCAAMGLEMASGAVMARTAAEAGGRAQSISDHEHRHVIVHAPVGRPGAASPGHRGRGAKPDHRARPRQAAAPHRTGATQRGQASVYASSLAGRRMADGGRFDPHSDTVASRTLPLGARARVTNLRNGRSVTVQVRDRGPNARRRILDVSPGVAALLGMGRTGTAPVAVTLLPGLAARAEAAPSSRR